MYLPTPGLKPGTRVRVMLVKPFYPWLKLLGFTG
jgi:hypothetical protein